MIGREQREQVYPLKIFFKHYFSITIFGTSAKYIQSLEDVGYKPKRHHNLSKLRMILSTGSPLKPESFDFVYKEIKNDLVLGSITGGTDICSLFAGNNAALPVYRGEIQCICLGMKIEAWNGQGMHHYMNVNIIF